MDIAEVVKVVITQIKETVRSETVVGTPVQAEDSVIIPVSRVSFGFGVGGGENDGGNKGGGMASGGGASVEPVAFIVVSKGKAQLLPLKSKEATVSRVIDIVPSLLELIRDCMMKNSGKAADEDETTKNEDKK